MGVPVIWPVVGLMESGEGSPVADQTYGGKPPTACTVNEYGELATPLGKAVVVMLIGPVTVTVSVTAGIFVPEAVRVAVPGPTEVIVTLVVGMLLPSQKKVHRRLYRDHAWIARRHGNRNSGSALRHCRRENQTLLYLRIESGNDQTLTGPGDGGADLNRDGLGCGEIR